MSVNFIRRKAYNYRLLPITPYLLNIKKNNDITMKKIYSTPVLNVVEINNSIICSSITNGGLGDKGAHGNNIELDFLEDDEFGDDNLF